MKAKQASLKVRVREPLRKSVENAAKKRGVSMNAEFVARLERSFRDEWLLDEIRKMLEARG